MLLKPLLKTIDESFIGRQVDKKGFVYFDTDPNRIYVENVRSFFNLTTSSAKLLCKIAVRRGLFRERKGVFCPNCHVLIKSYSPREIIEEPILCEICQLNEEEKYSFSKTEVKIMEYYQLNAPEYAY
jgi:hypothetical protein